VQITTTDQWYHVIHECNRWFGKNWRGQSRVKRKLDRSEWTSSIPLTTPVWFDVPNLEFATWITMKLGLPVACDTGK